MPNTFAWNIDDKSQPPSDWIAIVPNDDVDITSAAPNGGTIIGVRALRVESAGNIQVIMANGQERTLSFVAGEQRVGLFQRVLMRGTTAVDTGGEGIEGAV